MSQNKTKELPLSGQVFPSWRLEVPSLQRSLLRARYSKVLKVKTVPFRIHQTSAPKLPWSWSPNPPRSILWCSGTTSSTWSQKSMSKLSRNFCSDLCFGLFWLHVPGKCSQFVRTMLFQPLPRICEKLGRIKGGNIVCLARKWAEKWWFSGVYEAWLSWPNYLWGDIMMSL